MIIFKNMVKHESGGCFAKMVETSEKQREMIQPAHFPPTWSLAKTVSYNFGKSTKSLIIASPHSCEEMIQMSIDQIRIACAIKAGNLTVKGSQTLTKVLSALSQVEKDTIASNVVLEGKTAWKYLQQVAGGETEELENLRRKAFVVPVRANPKDLWLPYHYDNEPLMDQEGVVFGISDMQKTIFLREGPKHTAYEYQLKAADAYLMAPGVASGKCEDFTVKHAAEYKLSPGQETGYSFTYRAAARMEHTQPDDAKAFNDWIKQKTAAGREPSQEKGAVYLKQAFTQLGEEWAQQRHSEDKQQESRREVRERTDKPEKEESNKRPRQY